MSRRSHRNNSVVKIPCEFLNGSLRAYQVKIKDKSVFLSRQHTTKVEDAICVPVWLAKKEGLV